MLRLLLACKKSVLSESHLLLLDERALLAESNYFCILLSSRVI